MRNQTSKAATLAIRLRLAACAQLLVVAALLAAAQPAAAQPATVILPQVMGVAGERVATDLTLEDATGITGITLKILFDATMVLPDETITMGLFGGSITNFSGANIVGVDTLAVVVATFGDTTGYVGSGVLLTIEWDLIGAGTSPLEFVSVLLENNSSPPPLPSASTDGSIEVEPAAVDGASWGEVKVRYESDAIEP